MTPSSSSHRPPSRPSTDSAARHSRTLIGGRVHIAGVPRRSVASTSVTPYEFGALLRYAHSFAVPTCAGRSVPGTAPGQVLPDRLARAARTTARRVCARLIASTVDITGTVSSHADESGGKLNTPVVGVMRPTRP